MAILDILAFPDPRLRTQAKAVPEVNAKIIQFVTDLFDTMYDADGVGLAATQVNHHQQVIVMDISPIEPDEPRCFINPVLIQQAGSVMSQEGCLSVPNIFAEVPRAEQVVVQALDQQGKSFELEADGFLALCIQHEMDHLRGKLFVDYLSEAKRQKVKKILTKQRKADPDAGKNCDRVII